MLFLVLAAYGLLAQQIHGEIGVQVEGIHAKTQIVLRVMGLTYRREKQAKWTNKKKRKKLNRAFFLPRHAAKIVSLRVVSRVGMGDAMETAMAVGAVRAGIFSALCAAGLMEEACVSVAPDYEKLGFELHLCCIFSVTLGDIILSAAKDAVKRRRKEGKRWISTPLRA